MTLLLLCTSFPSIVTLSEAQRIHFTERNELNIFDMAHTVIEHNVFTT